MQKNSRTKYVDAQAGWKFLFFSVAIAVAVGLLFRVYFSPDRVKSWVAGGFNRQAFKVGVTFDGAEIRLSRGSRPQFAVVLQGVKVAPAPECHPEPSLRVAELTLPLRISSLLRGKFALGRVFAEDMVVDVDGLKAKCERVNGSAVASPAVATAASPTSRVAPKLEKTPDALATPWWTPDQLKSVSDVLEGFDFTKVQLQFENKTKTIYFESFSVRIPRGSETVRLSTEVRIPPELVFNEALPLLSIEGEASNMHADVRVHASLSEGILDAVGVLTPTSSGTPNIDLQMGVSDAPLSTMVPLLVKSGIASESFKPHFLWLNCRGSIKGPFQGLFKQSPFVIQNCVVEGSGTHMEILSATRQPSGHWDPFTVQLTRVDLNKAFQTFSVEGPSGIASDFGRLSGHLELKNENEARFEGAIEDARLRFSNRSNHVEQRITRLETALQLKDGRFTALLNKVSLENGRFDGDLALELDRTLKDGRIITRIKSMAFDPRVQEIMAGGTIGDVSGQADAKISGGHLASLDGNVKLTGVEGRDLKFPEAQLHTEYLPDHSYRLNLRSSVLSIRNSSSTFSGIKTVFFLHEFEGDWVDFKTVSLSSDVSPSGQLTWDKGVATLEDNRIQLTSGGELSRDLHVSAWVAIDYPKVKKLKWNLSGTLDQLVLKDDSKSLGDLRARVPQVDDAVLGL